MKPILIVILVITALFGVRSCVVDESKKGYVGGVSYEEIAGYRR